jgi:hypothetical protein
MKETTNLDWFMTYSMSVGDVSATITTKLECPVLTL